MPIQKTLAAPNGAPCTYFRALGLELQEAEPTSLKVRVGGWVQEADAIGGALPVFNWFPLVPVGLLQVSAPLQSLEQALVQVSGSPWLGGSLVAAATDLETARARRWALIKAERELAEFGPLTWDGSTFDANPQAQARIQGAAQLAALALQAGTPLQQDWTLADNTVRTLSAQQLLDLGRALGEQIGAAHATARGLRAAIEAAQTVDEISAVVWPESASETKNALGAPYHHADDL